MRHAGILFIIDQERGSPKTTFPKYLNKPGMSPQPKAGNFANGFRKCGIFPYNQDILEDNVFEYDLMSTTNGTIPVMVEEGNYLQRSTSPSTPACTSFSELSPLPVVQTHPPRNSRRKQETAVVTSAEYRNQVRNKPPTRGPRRQGGTEPNTSRDLQNNENYCNECGGYFFDDTAGQKWVKCVGDCNRWFHEACVENGNQTQFICNKCS
ncbi:hypothetical protein C0J52_03066 [Blattella germanica]|nr:hypothetical protein C0J52_03066 [Blattella germanica]